MCVSTYMDTHQSVKPCVPHTQQHMCTAHKHETLPNVWVRVSAGRTADSLRPEGPATGQLHQDFPRSFSVLQQTLSWEPNPTLQPFPRCQHFVLTQNQPQCPPSSPCCTSQHSTSQHRTFCTYQGFTLLPACLYQKDKRALLVSRQNNKPF